MILTSQYLNTGQGLKSAKLIITFWGNSWNRNDFAFENNSLLLPSTSVLRWEKSLKALIIKKKTYLYCCFFIRESSKCCMFLKKKITVHIISSMICFS